MDHDFVAASQEAPYYTVPSQSFAGIEYPGPVSSIPRALATLGGLSHVSSVLAAPDDAKRALELALNPKNSFHHPVQGAIMDTGNVLLQVRTRRRKRPKLDEHGNVEQAGAYIIEPVGVVQKTARFRAMADFQYSPPIVDPVMDMARAIRDMDVEKIQSFQFPPPDEDYLGRGLFLPPPVFSRQAVPHIYEFKPIPGSVPQTSVRQSGEKVERLVNLSRVKTVSQRTIAFSSATVPSGPDDESLKSRQVSHAAVEAKLRACLEERPVWVRSALANQLTPEDKRNFNNHKHLASLVSYTFSDGPFRELLVRFDYDPRTDSKARLYQRLAFRNPANVRSKNHVRAPTAKGKEKEEDSLLSHIFDGVAVHSKVGNFQLIDIIDPLSKALINSPDGVLPSCSSEPEGWYDPDYYEQIRQVVRRKWTGVHSGLQVTDDDCDDLLGDPKKVAFNKRGRGLTRAGKKNDSASGSSAAEDGEEPEGDSDEVGGVASGSGTSGAGSGSESGEGGKGKKKTGSRKKTQVKRAPWEGPKKHKRNMAKQPAAQETAEDKAARLRRAIGIGGTSAWHALRDKASRGESDDEGARAQSGSEEDESENDGEESD